MSSLGLKIDLRDAMSGTLLRVEGALKRGDVRKVMGRAVANKLRAYFVQLDNDRPNAFGGRRTHFWGQVRRSVSQPELVGGDGVQVAITHVGFALRLFGTAGLPGGVLRPVNSNWLTIPAVAAAYGKRAREFNDLHFVPLGAGLAALVQNKQTVLGRRRKDGSRRGAEIGGDVVFWLRKEVTQMPDPDVLPKEKDLGEAAASAGGEFLQSLVDRGEGVN